MSERRLAAIMFTDIVGYTTLMGTDEDKAFEILRKNRKLQKPLIEKYHGKWLKEMGDGILASFPTASDAVRCAGEIQQAARKQGISLRIGIHEGEVVFEGGDVLGDGVNVASRLEELTIEGGINISGAVYDNIKNKQGITAEYIGERTLKNVADPIKIYQVTTGPAIQETKEEPTVKKFYFRWPFIAFSGFGLVFIVAVLWWVGIIGPPSSVDIEEGQKSIAVLPFINDSREQETEYFANGVMESILNHLAKISDLRVPGRTSIEQYRGMIPKKSVKDIASELGVTYILEGSVQKSENMVRIHLQLLDGRKDQHVWSEQYDREYKNILQVESELAQTVAGELKARISPEEKRIIEKIPTTNLTAYDLFLRARDELIKNWMDNTNLDALKNALILYHRVLQYDSTYAQAYSGLALGYHTLGYHSNYHNNSDQKVNYGDSIIFYANKALSFNDQDEEAYIAKGTYYVHKGESNMALRELDQSIKINPNYSISYYYLAWVYYKVFKDYVNGLKSYFMAIQLEHGPMLTQYLTEAADIIGLEAGFPQKAKDYYDEILKLNNDSILYLNSVASLEYYMNNYSASIDFSKRILIKDALNNNALYNCMDCYERMDLYDELYKSALRYLQAGNKTGIFDQRRGHRIGYAFWKSGHKKESQKYFDEQQIYLEKELKKDHGNQSVQYDLACVYAFKGETGKALPLLNEVNKMEKVPFWFVQLIKVDPLLDNLRSDPGFQKILIDLENKYQKIHDEVGAWLEKEGKL